jgi:hypothetical protein
MVDEIDGGKPVISQIFIEIAEFGNKMMFLMILIKHEDFKF